MPREERRIYFDYDEAYKSVYSLCAQKGLPKPTPGHIIKMEFSTDNPLELAFMVENQRNTVVETSYYTKDFVVAALMIMCRNIGIPLPKGANKSLELNPGKVILRVQMIR